MNNRALCFAFIALAAASPSIAQKKIAADLSGSKEAAGKAPLSRVNAMLKEALETMSGVKSYHARAELTVANKKATIEGLMGVGMVDLKVLEVTGKTKLRRVANKRFFISDDNGKSWTEDKDKNSTIFLSNVITSPFDADLKLWEKGEFTEADGEVLDGEKLAVLTKPATKTEPAAQFWLGTDAKLGAVVRKAAITIKADDGEFPVTVTYSQLNVPVSISVPGGTTDDATADAPTGKKGEAGASANGESASVSALKNAVGAFSAQGVILTYMAVNSLGDAYAKKAYSKKEATNILATYEKTTSNIEGVLKGLAGNDTLSEADLAYIQMVRKAYTAIQNQIEALKGVIETGSKEDTAKFEANRQAGKKIMDEMFSDQ